jgi:hypothetical protein
MCFIVVFDNAPQAVCVQGISKFPECVAEQILALIESDSLVQLQPAIGEGRCLIPTTQDLLHGSFKAFHLNHKLFTGLILADKVRRRSVPDTFVPT